MKDLDAQVLGLAGLGNLVEYSLTITFIEFSIIAHLASLLLLTSHFTTND